jgi:transposase-like protein
MGDPCRLGRPEDPQVAARQLLSRISGTAADRRPIEGDWPYAWIDATYVKVRQPGRIVSVAVIIAVGVNTDGVRELGVAAGPSEAEPFWTEFLRRLIEKRQSNADKRAADGF